MKLVSFSILCLLIITFACRKDSFITSRDAQVRITADSLKYDTVFVSAGSVTQSFKIINENDRKLRVSSIRLLGGSSSVFKMNIDGVPTTAASDIEIAANDSIYVFVQVNVDPSVENLPFVLRDSIQVSYNGNERLVRLEAWGQNAHFIRDYDVLVDETWINDLPYVILGYLHVGQNTTLTIEKGCRIYVHADAPVIVDGTLRVNGEADTADRVVFTGDRLDAPYRDFPASWPGLYFRAGSSNNVFNYAIVKNAYQAIVVEGVSPVPGSKLTLNECIVDNAFDAGILSIHSSITARNTLISNCGKNVFLTGGGQYDFTHCTVVTISNSYINHREPVLRITDDDGNNNHGALSAVFRNCIFWGENGQVEDEVVVNRLGTNPFSINFDHVLWKVLNTPAPLDPAPTQVLNQPPLFDSIDAAKHYYDFRLKAGSPALDAGVDAGVSIDLHGLPRPVGLPDLGCFEKQ